MLGAWVANIYSREKQIECLPIMCLWQEHYMLLRTTSLNLVRLALTLPYVSHEADASQTSFIHR